MLRGLIALLAGFALLGGAAEAKDNCCKPIKYKKVKYSSCCQQQYIQPVCHQVATCQPTCQTSCQPACQVAPGAAGAHPQAVQELPPPPQEGAAPAPAPAAPKAPPPPAGEAAK